MAISIFQYTDFREFLKIALEERKAKSKAWSHRYIAQKIGLKSGGHISLILSGKASLKDKALDEFISLLKLSPSESLYFRNMVYYNQAADHREQKIWFDRMINSRDSVTTVLETQQYAYFSRWYYSAVREALTIFDFSGAEFQEFGTKMIPPLPGAKVREAMDLLLRLELIAKDPDGFFRPVNQIVTTGPQLHGFYFNEHISNILELARDAVQTIPVGEKYNSWVSMAISNNSFQKVVEEMRNSRKRILKIIEKEDNPERVFHLNMNLFPFTQKTKSKRK
jgi:uncharacterized protein (TIGR02147 family)